MDSKEFKIVFNDMAKANGFDKAFGGWFKESSECIMVLDLQKSNYGNYYQLMIKVYVQGVFGSTYVKSKDLVGKGGGNVFRGEPKEYKEVFSLENALSKDARKQELDSFFKEFLLPFSEKGLSRKGIRELAEQKEIHLLPAVEKQLSLLS